jgi:TetR/AcrR family transcriptional regulator
MSDKKPSRIQRKNRAAIMEAALDVFSTEGFRGATLDQIAAASGLSKPNLIYYFASKETIYTALLSTLLDNWLDPLRDVDAEGDPIEELLGYVVRKLQMSRDFPRESRLFANEILRGAPNILGQIEGSLKLLVDEKAAVIAKWADDKRIAQLDPHHLIFSIWATTQHYADFDIQVRTILHPSEDTQLKNAEKFLCELYRRTLSP